MEERKEFFYDAVVIGSGYGGSVAACRLSMAGLGVCLLEKGKRWGSRDFPTNARDLMSAARIQNSDMGFGLGSEDALLQVFLQGDSLAMTCCGLGGGSLVNAGVLLPPTVQARRNPRWPEAWEKDWGRNLASASDMLRGQSVPAKFQNSKVMEIVGGGDYEHGQVKLSVNFDVEDFGSARNQEIGKCQACGNCLTGCPYNAKLSNDKTYLAAAVQAGCNIMTQCEVQYVIENKGFDIFDKEDGSENHRQGRWLVFLDEYNYITSNTVILSAGVFGTAKILFQSKHRGLRISEMLGSGFSCNGNNFAFLSKSSAPLNAVGLDEKQLSRTPFADRPGPSISSLLTSSLGFTIQSAVVPRPFPKFLLKETASYGWQSCYAVLHAAVGMLKSVLGMDNDQDMALNVIGHDDSNGKLTFDKETNRVLFKPPHDPLLPQKTEALKNLAKKLGGVIHTPQYRSLSVHLLGGCIVAPDVSSGVCNPDGQVFDTSSPTGVHQGLYICDASIIPCSVGINPCLTIAAAAEHISRNLVRDLTNENSDVRNSTTNPSSACEMIKNSGSKVTFKEVMRGQICGRQCTAYLNVNLKLKDETLLQGEVSGYIKCMSIETEKMHIIHGEVDLCETKSRTPYTHYMHYHLLLAASSGARYEFEGRKIMNPYLLGVYAWRESTTLNVTLRKISGNGSKNDTMHLNGKIHISPLELLKAVWSLKGESKFKFVYLLMESLFRTYVRQVPRGSHMIFDAKELIRTQYPQSTMHELMTDDGVKIRIQHWQCNHFLNQLESRAARNPVLLLNGYATESYCLPTEPTDLVRTLLRDGHDVWLLHPRLHWSVASNDFTIEDIGRFDIPTGIDKMNESYGDSTKIHVIGHCVGGLALHIGLMGGHVSTKRIASLTCSNSSMFYKLTTSSLVKLWVPLLPISMMILGDDTILPMLEESPASFRHRALKQIARTIPRHERCTCDECEVVSGIFGNAFWHENVSPATHRWLNRANLPKLPMSGFRHLRKICNAGFVVDGDGRNRYLMHPERMAFPTMYVSGGRTLLVTPETSFLAEKYMKMHQPSFRHERVVVDGYGHSDLWIGEKSAEKVFPHVRKHIRLAEEEEEEEGEMTVKKWDGRRSNEETMWSHDPYDEENGRIPWKWLILFFIAIFVLCVSLII